MPAHAIVPGDLLVLEAGDFAAADGRLYTAHALTTNEAPLTGESAPVEKTTTPTGSDIPHAERHDFVSMGTSLAVAAVPEGRPAVVTIALAVGGSGWQRATSLSAGCLPWKHSAAPQLFAQTSTLPTGVMQVREPWSRDHARLMFAAAACSDAQVRADGQTGVGDRTELAILTAAAERGIHRDEIEHTNARIAEIPFDSVLKRMSIQCADSH